jgi:transcriptional regulator with XRE-family HTH domain
MTLLTDGDKIRLARIGKDLKLSDLALEFSCSISLLSKVEHNCRSIPKEIAVFLEVDNGVVDWYETIINALYALDEREREHALNSLNNALKIGEKND